MKNVRRKREDIDPSEFQVPQDAISSTSGTDSCTTVPKIHGAVVPQEPQRQLVHQERQQLLDVSIRRKKLFIKTSRSNYVFGTQSGFRKVGIFPPFIDAFLLSGQRNLEAKFAFHFSERVSEVSSKLNAATIWSGILDLYFDFQYVILEQNFLHHGSTLVESYHDLNSTVIGVPHNLNTYFDNKHDMEVMRKARVDYTYHDFDS